MAYLIRYTVAYEGLQEHQVETLDDVRDWLKAMQMDLDRVEVMATSPFIDVYELMRGVE